MFFVPCIVIKLCNVNQQKGVHFVGLYYIIVNIFVFSQTQKYFII